MLPVLSIRTNGCGSWNAVLGGGVRIGAGAYVGQGATVREGLSIGPGAVVGMGSVVLHDIPAGEVLAGGYSGDAR